MLGSLTRVSGQAPTFFGALTLTLSVWLCVCVWVGSGAGHPFWELMQLLAWGQP